ncbi:uncharacterized protein F4822DRAFT_430957 [Hypoxylon trugodes]|uniref:uncharacterized protein n=1 Tax=Hypoxylon trugodes TaxID=326681 RepID=UPI00219697DD|nr:uncharacterized protein F4822DRAFT_430957 [Hypoxylon trugodes]KAI1386086.1 hypothetical protein F4822DRAFT_430957 [Hypoxylon trugodes]
MSDPISLGLAITPLVIEGEPLVEAVKRLRTRVKITLNHSSYNEALAKLKESNYDLRDIRTHLKELNSQGSHPSTPTTEVAPASASISASPEREETRRVGLAAHALYEVMGTSWVCDIQSHRRHLVRLFVSTRVEEDVQMNLSLSGDHRHQPSYDLSVPSLEHGTLSVARPIEFPLLVRASIINNSLAAGLGPIDVKTSTESQTSKRRKVVRVEFDNG